jgi:hypothetical protein
MEIQANVRERFSILLFYSLFYCCSIGWALGETTREEGTSHINCPAWRIFLWVDRLHHFLYNEYLRPTQGIYPQGLHIIIYIATDARSKLSTAVYQIYLCALRKYRLLPRNSNSQRFLRVFCKDAYRYTSIGTHNF